MKVLVCPKWGGERYHTRDCTGLNQSVDVEEVELDDLPETYELCTICDEGESYAKDWSYRDALLNADPGDIDA